MNDPNRREWRRQRHGHRRGKPRNQHACRQAQTHWDEIQLCAGKYIICEQSGFEKLIPWPVGDIFNWQLAKNISYTDPSYLAYYPLVGLLKSQKAPLPISPKLKNNLYRDLYI